MESAGDRGVLLVATGTVATLGKPQWFYPFYPLWIFIFKLCPGCLFCLYPNQHRCFFSNSFSLVVEALANYSALFSLSF